MGRSKAVGFSMAVEVAALPTLGLLGITASTSFLWATWSRRTLCTCSISTRFLTTLPWPTTNSSTISLLTSTKTHSEIRRHAQSTSCPTSSKKQLQLLSATPFLKSKSLCPSSTAAVALSSMESESPGLSTRVARSGTQRHSG